MIKTHVVKWLLLLALLPTGCSHTPKLQLRTSAPAGQQWIKLKNTEKPATYYVVTGDKISATGKLLGKLNIQVTHQGAYETQTNDPKAVETLSIPGISISKAVAVKLKDESIMKAMAIGTHQL